MTCLFIISVSPSQAQVTADPFQPFQEGEVIDFPGAGQYLGDLPPDIQRLSTDREYESLQGAGAGLPGWDFSNPGLSGGFYSRSPGLVFENIPNPFGASPYLNHLAGGLTADWFALPSAAWWGPAAAGGAIILRPGLSSDGVSTFFSTGIAGNLNENLYLKIADKDGSFTLFGKDSQFSDFNPSDNSRGILGEVNIIKNSSYVLSLDGLTFGNDENLYWSVLAPRFTWLGGDFFTLDFEPYLAYSGEGGQNVQETGGMLNGDFNLAGLAQSQLGIGFVSQDWNPQPVNPTIQKSYLQNSEWIDLIGVLLAQAAFRCDFIGDQTSQFSWLSGLKFVQDNWNFFAEASKSVQSNGDFLQWEIGTAQQQNDMWRWDLEYLLFEVPSGDSSGLRGHGAISIPVSNQLGLEHLVFHLSLQDVWNPTEDSSYDLGGELDLELKGKSKVWCLFRKLQNVDWLGELGGEWRILSSVGVYAYLDHRPSGDLSWPEEGFSSPTFVGLGLRAGF